MCPGTTGTCPIRPGPLQRYGWGIGRYGTPSVARRVLSTEVCEFEGTTGPSSVRHLPAASLSLGFGRSFLARGLRRVAAFSAPVGRRRMSGFHERFDSPHGFVIRVGDISRFSDVVREIIELK